MIGLREIRKKRKLNQQKVAFDLNISRESLSYYENGKREPSLALLVDMSKYFNVSINYLITGKEFEKAFEKYDVIIAPTAPNVAFDIGEKSNNPLELYMEDLCTVPINVAGVPAISIPCGVSKDGMPIGMQIIGKHFDEETILNAAYTYEQRAKFREKFKPQFIK